MIIAGMAAPLGLAQPVTSQSGLRLERFGDPQRPTVALFLPRIPFPSVVIEMPEHAWRTEKPTDEQAWFYKMYSSDPAFRGTVTWSNAADSLAFTMKTPSGFTMNSRATLEADGVSITHEVISATVLNLAAVEATTCVKLYRPFSDVFLERTYIHHREGLELIASETPGRLEENAEEWLPCRYIARVGKNDPPKPYRAEKIDGVMKYFKSRAADSAFLATESQPAGWTVATHANDCDSVFTNPARTCHHADPRATSITDGKATLRLKVYVLQGTAKDAWNAAEKRELSGLA